MKVKARDSAKRIDVHDDHGRWLFSINTDPTDDDVIFLPGCDVDWTANGEDEIIGDMWLSYKEKR